MKKRITSLLLALIMLLQIALPQNIFAEEDNKSLPHDKNVKMGEINAKSYGAKMMLELNRLAARERKQKTSNNGFQLFSGGPYFGDDNEPTDENKPKYHGNVKAKLSVKGLNDEQFQWNEIFGVDEEGNPKPAQLIFTQINDDTGVETGVERYLKITKAGTYAWTDGDGNPAELPLFSDKLEPFFYEVRIDEDVAEKVQLLTATLFGSEDASPTFEQPDAEGRIKFNLVLDLTLQQVTSTKFTSKWNTGLGEEDRPQIQADAKFSGVYMGELKTKNLTIGLPKNDTDEVIVRDLEDTGDPNLVITERLYNKAQVEIKTDTQGLEFDTTNKTVTSGDHKFKYDFTYDVINGGKLTMTEVIHVTFNANGGKFASLDENAEQKIVKEVDYEGTLTDNAENPTKERETFKGWATDKDGKNPVTDADFTNIKEAKTFYAIWDNNEITAEELTVHESFKDGTDYVNDFIPDLVKLKGQVKIKDANGVPQALTDDDTFEILNDSGTAITGDDLKNYLYEKLQEKANPNDEPTRVETVKAKVTVNGISKEVDIPIKVIKNIYEGTSTGGKPSYVPENYVKVTVDPTDKATDPQKTVYYVNPDAKVVIPGENPVGKGDNVFTKWTMKEDSATGDGADYDLPSRHQFGEASTITAQYEKEKQGIIKIKYVDENGEVIPKGKRTGGGEYLTEKQGKLNSIVNKEEFISIAPEFEGYVLDRFQYGPKTSIYTENGRNTVTYHYYKKVTTEDKSKDSRHYFKVVFDANGGEFKTDPKDKKDVYIYSVEKGINKDFKASFKEVRAEVERVYNTPTKEGSTFKEWQDNATEGSKVADDHKVAKDEIFYAHYENPSAKVVYLDLDGKTIADEFKIDGVDYPTEKAGKLGDKIADDVFTKENAPKLIGYKFNRIEINPKGSAYTFDNKATIKIYYGKLPDVIPEKDGSGNPNEKPDGYVEVKFVPTDKAKDTTEKIFYVNPKKDVTIPIANPEAKATFTFKEWKMGANAEGATYTPSTAQKFTEKETVITATYEEGKDIIPYDPSATDPMPRPEGYVRVTFAADPGLKLTENKAYYVKANAGILLGNEELVKPKYDVETGYKFEKWDKDDTTVIAETDIVVTAKATKLDPVIPEKDGEGNPNEKPEGYKEVTFVVKTGDESKGSIEGVAKFYVNPTEFVTINPPTTKANTGFEFGAWDKDATIPTVYDKDTTITGSFNGLKDVIPKTNPDGTENKQPEGYKTVTFVIDPATGGKIADKEVAVYYVNPDKEVTVPQPKTQADTGYEFDKWKIGDQEFPTEAKKYTDNTTVKGNFKKLADIIPGKKDDGTPNAKPEGYVTVTFDKGTNGKSITGQTVYYVNPKANITLGNETIVKPKVTPETGWKADGWDKLDTLTITKDETVTAKYASIDDVIPKTKDDESEKPEGYITVTFEKGAHGELEGNTVFYINPNKAVVLEGKAPTIKPNTGYTSAGWDTSINKAIQYKDGDKITALYNELGDVIPQEDPNGSDKPAGYLTVTFVKGDHGKELTGKTVYYVKPNKEVTIPAPTVTPETGWKQKDGTDAWDSKLTRTFTEDTKITAQYASLADIIPGDQTKPDGYVTVTFKAENGSLVGTTSYYVKPNVEVNLKDKADALTKNPDVGYIEVGGTWDPTVGPKTYTGDATYTFKFKKLDDIIPGDQTTERPKGYVKVEFRSDINGSLTGNTIFYVNPNAKKTMSDITPLPTIKANKGYKVGNPNWHADFTNDTTEIKEDRIYVANYEALGEAKITYIPRDPEMGSVSPGSEDLSEDQAIKGSTATANPGYEFVKWINTKGDTVSDNAKFVPSEKQSTTYIAVFKAKDPVTFTVNKVWEGDVNPLPTMNFTLYRQVEGGTEEAVPGAEVKEITKDVTEATWTGLAKTDANGVAYEYSVKETFADESADVKNANWILGEMVTDANGNTITNKLKTVPGTGDIPNENEHRMGKLTITKKIESKVIQPQMSRSMHRAPAAPLAFTFKVTDPYGNVETFTLKAGESKELNNLLYGDYTVEETDAKGLTPFVKVGNGDETKSSTAKVTLTTTDKEGTVTFTNKNVKPEENPNIIEVTASKVWVNGPSKDHTAVDLKLYRQADGGQVEEVTDVTPVKSRDANDVNKFNYVWKDLPKINDEGKKYTYTVEEANVTDNKVTVNGNTYTVTQDGNTITNTYVVPQTEDLIATKQWVGVPDGTAKPEVKFQLQRTANGVTEDVGDAMALTNNQVNFGKQDKTDKDGKVYTYFVKEVNADGSAFNDANYTSEVNGLTVTNTYHAPEVKFTVTYLPGSSTATGTMAADTDVRGTYTVKAIGFTNDGYTFKGWKVGDTTQIVQPGDTINVTGDVTLTAQWEKTTTPPTPDPDNPNPDKPNPWDPDPKPWNPDYPKPWNPNYPDLPYIPRYPEIRYETIVQEKIVKVPVPIPDNAYVKEVRYMQGFMGDFRPKDGLTRAEAAQILANALVEDGYKYNPNFKLPYKDIGEAWYTRAVKIVTEAKVFAGYDDGNFKPQDKITRNEWIATLKRFQELGDVSGNHMKLKDGHWAMAEIEAAYKEGWLKIYSDGLATYEGDKFIPREEVAAVSNKAFNRVLDKTYIINNDKNLITYKDVKKDMWSYEDVLCASNTFLYKKDLYRAHWIKEDNNQFNINIDGFEIVKAKFQRNPR